MNGISLQALYSFYLVADLGSLKAAAEKQNITAGAMSQQIRQLEDRLNVTLFERQHRKVVLTAEGKSLLPFVEQGFMSIQNGIGQIKQDTDPNSLSISTLSSFAQQWLVPRLGKFANLEPSLSIKLMATATLANFNQDPVDICIRFGRGKYEGLDSRLLMTDSLYAVCHPLYLQHQPIEKVDDLLNARLLEDARPDMNWSKWLEHAGISSDKANIKPSLELDGTHMVLDAALAVQGVALARHSVAWRYLEQGLLVRLFDMEVKSDFSYFVCAPPSYFARPKVAVFSDWLQNEAAEFLKISRG